MIYQNSVAALSEPLTDYVNEGATDATMFKGLQLAPALPVETLSGTYPKLTIAKGELMRAATRRRAPGSNFNRWQMALESGSLALEQIGEEQSVPDEHAMEWDNYFDLEAIAADESMNRLRRGHEIEVATALMNSTTFTAANGSVAYAIGNVATINFQLDLYAAIRALNGRGVRPDTVVVPGTIYDVLIQTDKLKTFLAGSLAAGTEVNSDSLQRAFSRLGITNVIVADGYVNQGDTGVPELNQIWGDNYVWVGKTGSGTLRSGGALATAYWNKAGPLFMVSQYRDEAKKSNIVRGETISNVIVTNSRAGQLIGTQV